MSSTEFLKRAYALKSTQEASEFYDEWAANYNTDMTNLDYHLPRVVASAVPAHTNIKDLSTSGILDAGCGTGLLGQELSKLGATTIDGLDISSGMLQVAKKTGVYRHLNVADLSKKLDLQDESYGCVVCSGTLTHGHVGPEALGEFVRVTKSGGIVAVSIIDDIWVEKGYKDEVERLESQKKVVIVSTDQVEFRKEKGVYVRLVVLRKV